MQEYLFVLITQTGTNVSKCIKLFTRKPYNHASVAMDLTLEEMYSFCRTYRHFPLPATFNREIVGKGTLGQFLTIPCEIYAIPVSAESKKEFNRYLEHFKTCRSNYSYNILGLCTTFLRIRWSRSKKLHCSEFVARLLQYTGVHLEKPASLYTPDDLRYIPNALLIYRGELNRFYAMCQQQLPAIQQRLHN